MRHRVFGKKLGRDIKERKALFRSLVSSLILYGRIKTTSMSILMSFFNRKEPVKKLLDEIAPRFKDKIGGYIRMIRLGTRTGDNAQEVLMEWTVKEEPKAKIQKALPKTKTQIKKQKVKSKS